MLRHVVMFTFADDVTDADRQAIADGLDGLASMPGVVSYLHGPDAGLVDGNWDYAIVGDFESTEAYNAYAQDPGHLELIASTIRPKITGRVAVQYEV